MKQIYSESETDIFVDRGPDIYDDIDQDDKFDDECDFEGNCNIDDIFEECAPSGEDDADNTDKLLSYKDYAVQKSRTKKVSSQNYDAADIHSTKQDISMPYDCMDNDSYFNEDLELSACEVIKGTTLERYEDGRHIPIKDVVTCFVRLADKWPDDLVYCFTLIAYYGKVLRYKSLLDAIPTSYRDKMIEQLSRSGAEMIKSLYKSTATVVDIFC